MYRGICTAAQGFADGRGGDNLSTFGGFGRFFTGRTRPEKGKRGRRRRVTVRKLPRERVLDIIREHVIEESRIPSRQHGCITVEGVASQLRLQPAKVHWAFMILNREGWMSQGYNLAPHDSPRDYLAGGDESAWRATWYDLRRQTIRPRNPCGEIPLRDDFSHPEGAVFIYDEEVAPPKKRYSKRLRRRVG